MATPAGYALVNHRFTNADNANGAEITYGVDLALFGGSPDDAADTIVTRWLSANWDGLYVSSWSMVEVTVKYGPVDVGATGADVASLVGEAAGSSVPSNTAAIFRKSTSLGGRRGRGRFYLPGIPEDQVDGGGNISGVWLADAQGIATAFLTGLASDLLPMVLLHDVGLSPAPEPTLVTGLAPLQRCGTQRGRMR